MSGKRDAAPAVAPAMPSPDMMGMGMGGGDDFLKQIEGTWRQIKMKTEELQRSQAENARLAGLLDKATADIAGSAAREQEMRSRVVSLTTAVKERDAMCASLQEGLAQLQAQHNAALQDFGTMQAQYAELVERYQHGEAVNMNLHERLHALEHGEGGIEALKSKFAVQMDELTAKLNDEKQRTEVAKRELAERAAALDREKSELNKCVPQGCSIPLALTFHHICFDACLHMDSVEHGCGFSRQCEHV